MSEDKNLSLFQSFVQHIPVAIFRCQHGSQCKFKYISHEIESITGKNVKSFLDQPISGFVEMILPEHILKFQQTLNKSMADKSVFDIEFRIRNQAGELRWIKARGKSFDGSDEGAALYIDGVFIDITKEKNIQDALDEERLKTIQSSRLVLLGEMSSGIAHEINNPLSIIIGKTELIKNKLKKINSIPEDIVTDLEKISVTALRIAKIISGMRKFSRDDSNEPMSRTSVKKIIFESLDFCQVDLHRKGVTIQYNDQYQDFDLLCRQVQLSQVLVNLIKNSCDAISELIQKWITIEVKPHAEFIEISIMDSGSGIPQDVVQRMMEPFFTTKGVGQGTGLGLGISKGIVEAHGGRIYYDSKSTNTRFVIQLPVREGVILMALDVDDAIEAHLAWKKKL
ncbi:MAG TPA: ATP-binding protein, partial [Pseudobdellovibrionaceae bacterium]|nr:ATP-binding protein [Pseudobdellovibrionaceae bacterium]